MLMSRSLYGNTRTVWRLNRLLDRREACLAGGKIYQRLGMLFFPARVRISHGILEHIRHLCMPNLAYTQDNS